MGRGLTSLGPYEILGPLGAGGMGEVYRARDSKLNREVALKVLPEFLALDPDRVARFKREAQVLASLNHPNIAAIYGFEDSDGVPALVLELVPGPTLADRIADGPIPLAEALLVARQIAEALEAAHEQGVVHRDLKPANIKMRPDGTVKVLDFGLAKLVGPSESAPQAADLSQPPTMTSLTAAGPGVIMGTAAYMSPEQARGRGVGKRTDIWAFGCVLFEMLSGRAAFSAETIPDTIARVLEREPDWRVLPASTPARIRDLLVRCLNKDQQRRLHDIADARIELEDARATLSRPRRTVGLPVVAGAFAVALGILAGAWWYPRRSIPSVPHEPVSVLIADVQNHTEDPTFDRTLEPLLRIVMESAGFVSAYDRTQVSRNLGVRPPDNLDERAALEIAVKQGVGVVLSGSLDRQGAGYRVSVKATRAVTGAVVTSAEATAPTKDRVLGIATTLVAGVREALGDDTSDSAQRFAMETLSATSLDVVRDYAKGAEALSNLQFAEAREGFLKALDRDPSFGLAYAGLASVSRNLNKQEDAEKYIKEALRHLEGMTERERYRTRGLYYMVTGDLQECVKEFGDLIERYAADVSARNNRAVCLSDLREMPRAVDEMRQVVKILPKRTLYRTNLALYENYAGNFKAGEQEARAIQEPGVFGLIALAFAQLGQGQLRETAETYQRMAKIDALGASYAASGLADLALYEGRLSDAVRLLEQGAAVDLASGASDRAARKFASVAHVQLLWQHERAAIDAAEEAQANSKTVNVRFLAARVFLEAGEIARARELAAGLTSDVQADAQAYARIVEGGAALKTGDARRAIKLLTEANTLLDTWLGHFDLGRAYLEGGAFTQADSEFDRCIKRRGEALSVLVDQEPTYGLLPAVYYYQGRVRERLNSVSFPESYRTYLGIREAAGEDPLLPEVRRRAGRERP